MDDILVKILTILGGLSGMAAVINAVVSRRKVGADAASVLTQAASGLVSDLRREVDDLKAWKREEVQLLDAHRRWDRLVAQHLKDAGIDVPDPPPLTPDA
jgi:hypothetical protein